GVKPVPPGNATQPIHPCREACGGEGYIARNRISALKADTDIYTTFEGDNTVLMQLVAKNLLNELKDKLKEMRPGQVLRYFIDQRSPALAKRDPRSTFKTGRKHLRDTNFQLKLFKLRESVTLYAAAHQLHRLLFKKRLDQYSAFAY